MKIPIDMYLSPSRVQVLEDRGFQALHWSSVGEGSAADTVVLVSKAARALGREVKLELV